MAVKKTTTPPKKAAVTAKKVTPLKTTAPTPEQEITPAVSSAIIGEAVNHSVTFDELKNLRSK